MINLIFFYIKNKIQKIKKTDIQNTHFLKVNFSEIIVKKMTAIIL